MSTALLDTNVLVDIYRNRRSATQSLMQLEVKTFCFSILTYAEFLGGASIRHKAETRKFLSKFPIIDIDTSITNEVKKLSYSNALHKNHIHDLFIAATAISKKFILVTANVKHFPYKAIHIHKYETGFFI